MRLYPNVAAVWSVLSHASFSDGYLDAEEFRILKDFIETEKQMLLATQQ